VSVQEEERMTKKYFGPDDRISALQGVSVLCTVPVVFVTRTN
jgi:hypothetical protein